MMSASTSYQHEPIPVMFNSEQSYQAIPIEPQYKDHSVAYISPLKANRVVPQQLDYNTYYQPKISARTPSSMQSNRALILPPQTYSLNQAPTQTPYVYNSNQSNYPQSQYIENAYLENDYEKDKNSTSYFSQPSCFGLSRFTAILLFGTMILISTVSIGGLIVSVILYVQDSNSSSQWKILGMVVSSVMLITIIVTLCIFIYCYENGRIGNKGNKNSLATAEYNDDNDFRKTQYFNRSYNMSSLPYGKIQRVSPFFTTDNVVQVEDKQTNTETTMAPLRPRDCQRGVWPAMNAYGGLSYRSSKKPLMKHCFIQASPEEVDRATSLAKSNIGNPAQKKIIRLPTTTRQPYFKEQYPSRFIEQEQLYDADETIVPRAGMTPTRENIDFMKYTRTGTEGIEGSRKIQINNHTPVMHIKPFEQPHAENDFSVDHFYQ